MQTVINSLVAFCGLTEDAAETAVDNMLFALANDTDARRSFKSLLAEMVAAEKDMRENS